MRFFLISLFFFLSVLANAQQPGITGLRKFSFSDSYKSSYYDSLMTKRTTTYLYDKAGRTTAFIQMLDKDTTEYASVEYNEKGQMMRRTRHWNPQYVPTTDEYGNPIAVRDDSVCEYQYDAKGRMIAYHAREFSKTEVFDSATSEYKPGAYVVNWIYKVSFDKQDNPVLERTKKFDMIGKDTVYKHDITDNIIQYKYNEKDSLVSMKRINYPDNTFTKFEKRQYGPFGRIGWQKWERSTFIDSLAANITYDSKGKILKQKIKKFDYDYSAEKRKLAASTEYFYNDSGKVIRRETVTGKEKKTEYLSGTKTDSIVYFENNIRKPSEAAKLLDTIPALARLEHYDEMWSDGARLEYDKAGHLVLLAFTLDGFYQHVEYEWVEDRMTRKIWKDRDGEIKQMQEYVYEFY